MKQLYRYNDLARMFHVGNRSILGIIRKLNIEPYATVGTHPLFDEAAKVRIENYTKAIMEYETNANR